MSERFISPSTPLTPREREILDIVIEEAAEVIQRATKALRFGLDETQPGQPHDNAARLAHEIGDLWEVVALAEAEGLVSTDDIINGQIRKRDKLKVYMQTQPVEA